MAAATTSAAAEPALSTTPLSPPRRPRRKHQDSFMLFENASFAKDTSAEDLSKYSIAEHSPEREGNAAQDADAEPMLSRLVMMPLLSISFILSLVLVERSERARRSSEHPSRTVDTSFWSTFTLQNWLDPEPYQDAGDTTWQDAGSGADGTQHAGAQKAAAQKRQRWFLRKKLRKIGRMEITDALEMRGAVMVALLAIGAVTVVGLGWIGLKSYHGLMARLR